MYSDGDLGKHALWHSIYYSLQFHPEYRDRFAAQHEFADGDDMPMVAAKNYLADNPEEQTDDIYNEIGNVKWTATEKFIRLAFFEFFKEHPSFTLETLLWYKPKIIIIDAVKFYFSALKALGISVGLFALFIIFIVFGLIHTASTRCRRKILALFFVSMGGVMVSVLPNWIAVGYMHVMGEFLTMMMVAVALGLPLLVSSLVTNSSRRLSL